jgi:hypothetical protein
LLQQVLSYLFSVIVLINTVAIPQIPEKCFSWEELYATEPHYHTWEDLSAAEPYYCDIETEPLVHGLSDRVYEIPAGADTFFSWMDYRQITARNSQRWQLQQQAATDDSGLRVVDGHYVVAMGTHYADYVGKRLRITIDTGVEFNVIIGDIKGNHEFHHPNGCMLEFVVCRRSLYADARRNGDISAITMFAGAVVDVRNYEED